MKNNRNLTIEKIEEITLRAFESIENVNIELTEEKIIYDDGVMVKFWNNKQTHEASCHIPYRITTNKAVDIIETMARAWAEHNKNQALQNNADELK